MNITELRYVICFNFPLIFVKIVFGPWNEIWTMDYGQLIN